MFDIDSLERAELEDFKKLDRKRTIQTALDLIELYCTECRTATHDEFVTHILERIQTVAQNASKEAQ